MSTSSPESHLPRRGFLKTAATLATGAAVTATVAPRFLSAAERKRSVGANSRIRIAQIGCGRRGLDQHLEGGILPHREAMNFEVVAFADVHKPTREETNAKIKEWFGRKAKAFSSYREVLAMDDVDAVMIATPDHLHTTHLEAAAKAGKHIYVEKFLATEFDKLLRAYDAAKAAEARGSVIQVGTQARSRPDIVGARELMRSGVLGRISRITEVRNGEKPFWAWRIRDDIKAEDVDWKEFLGDRPMQPFNSRKFSCWYGYYEFCQGPVPQWGSHFFDTIHFVTECGFPVSCTCHGTTFLKDENNFTVPDNVVATWLYPEGFLLTSSNNFANGAGDLKRVYCEHGTLALDNRAPTYSAEGGPKRDGKIRGINEVKEVDQPDHFLNWLQCMRTGQRPHASIDAGYQHAVAVLMAVMSYDSGRKTVYDHRKRSIRLV